MKRPKPVNYPKWGSVKHLFSRDTQELVAAAKASGRRIFVMDGDVQSHQDLICPRANQPFVVGFRDTDGTFHEEFKLQLHPNALSVQFLDESLAARPPYPMFTIGNQVPSYHPALENQYPALSGGSLRASARDWLSRRDLIVFRFTAADGMVQGEFVAPIEMANVVQGFALVHRVPLYSELSKLPKATNTTFWVAPGLRRTLFGGNQNVTFYPGLNGKIFVIGNSTYDGALYKKPLFNVIGYQLAWMGGMGLHASMASPLLRELEELVFAILCDSGRGKTELRKALDMFLTNQDREILLGFRTIGGHFKAITIPAKREKILKWLGLGDDGVSVLDLLDFQGINWEHGAFDRNSGAYKEGDIIELDDMLKQTKWWQARTLNLRANPGDLLSHWERVTMSDGNPAPNPRITYGNRELLKVGVKVKRKKVRVKNVFYAFAPTQGVTAAGPWTELPRGIAWVYEVLGGPDSPKSKSVSAANVPQDKVMRPKQVKFAHIGSNAQFTPTPIGFQVDQVLTRHANSHGVGRYMVIQERKPTAEQLGRSLATAEKEIEYGPELMLRDTLAKSQIAGNTHLRWKRSPYPFLGYWPESVTFDGHHVNDAYFRPELIYGQEHERLTQAWFDSVCGELDVLEKRGISPQAKALFHQFTGMFGADRKVHPMSASEFDAVLANLEEHLDAYKGKELKFSLAVVE